MMQVRLRQSNAYTGENGTEKYDPLTAQMGQRLNLLHTIRLDQL